MKLAVFAIAVWVATLAQAEPTSTIVRDLSGPVAATAVDSYGAPDALAGALATAFFSDGSFQQALFTAAGSGSLSSASAVGTRFVLGATDSLDISRPGDWFVTNLDASAALVGFAIDGRGRGAGSVAFDVSVFTTSADTPGSGTGIEMLMDFTGRTFITGSVTTTYSAPVALNGAVAAGDLFAQVRVDLGYRESVLGGGLPPLTVLGGNFSSQRFRSDLDTVSYAPVPEPASAALLLAGGAALLFRARRRQR